MDRAAFRARTRRFALEILRLVDELPRGRSTDIVARQLGRCGTSVDANYRASGRSRSVAEMIAKLGIVEEEADEAQGWLELLVEGGYVPKERVGALIDESSQIVAMTVASIKTLRKSQIKDSSAPSAIRDQRSEI